MQSHRPFLTQHRLQRFILWTLTMLRWIAAILPNTCALSQRHQRQRFDISLPWLTRLVGRLLLIRAAQLAHRRLHKPNYWRHGRDLRHAHLLRSALGARLRRMLTHRDLRTWIARLIAVLRDLDAHATPLAHRLRRGLTRIWRTWAPIGRPEPALDTSAPTPALADSS